MKYIKNRVLVAACILCILSLSACGNASAVKKYDKIVKSELKYESSALGKVMSNRVKVKVKSVTESKVIVEVSAPIVTGDLIIWYESLEKDSQIDDSEIEEEVSTVIKCAKDRIKEYELSYVEDSILYTGDYINHVTCGTDGFYAYLLEEMFNSLISEEDEFYEW